MYGSLEFGYGDYLVIPRGTIYLVLNLRQKITGYLLLNLSAR